MTFTVSFDETDGIVRVSVSGLATHDEHCSARDEALRLCRENHCNKLLVDLRELDTAQSSTMGCFTFGKSVVQALQRFKLAHVLPTDTKSRDDVRFTLTVETNRGITAREFETIEKAQEWLIG